MEFPVYTGKMIHMKRELREHIYIYIAIYLLYTYVTIE